MKAQRPGRQWGSMFGAGLASLALAAVGCGGDEEKGGGAAGGDKKESQALTLIAGVKGDEFYITMSCGAEAEAKKQGVKYNFQGPDQFDASLQTPVLNAVTANKPDAILIAPTDTKAMYAPVKAAADSGSKVVLVDTTLEQSDFAVSEIASDNEGGGREAARALGELIGGKGKVFVVNVKPGISTTDARAKGFEEEAKKIGLEYSGQDFSNDQPEKAAAIVKAQLAKDPDLKGIFATNLFSAEGAASGLREADKLGDVKIVGFDAGPKQVEDLNEGLVQALIAQRPAEIGRLGVQQAVASLNDQPTKKKIGTDFVTLTKENIGENQDAIYKSSC